MATKNKELAEAVLNLIEQSDSSLEAARAIAAYLVAERRTKDLNNLLRQLEELNFNQHGQVEVTATAARPLSAEAKQMIKDIFAAPSVKIHEEIDKNALGGVRVRALDKVADFSVRARLQRLRAGRSL